MIEEDTYEFAQKYAEKYGFSVFPTYGIITLTAPNGTRLLACSCGSPRCVSPGKHPAVGKGRNSASKISIVVESLWASRTGLNLGVATGSESGIFVVDIDGIIGEESLTKLESEHRKLPKTLTSITGRGRHLIFKYPTKKVYNRTSALGKCLDIRGEGGYCVFPPSKHISGFIYKWEDDSIPIADAPQWLLNLVCADAKAPVVNEHVLKFDSHQQTSDWTQTDVISMLEFVDPDMPYQQWVDIGMAVHDAGFSFDIWDGWSRRGHKYDGSTGNHWKSFRGGGGITIGTLVHEAQIRGWKPTSYITEDKIDWDTHPARAWLIELGAIKNKLPEAPKTIAEIKKDYKMDGFPLDAYHHFDGVIGETIRWICDTAISPQPVLSMLNVFTALGAIFGRRYASPLDGRTNLFTVGIAGSGIGKEHSRGKIMEIMGAAGYDSYLASDEIKSGPGLLTTLEKTPSCIMMLDEFGMVLKSISGERAAPYKIEISEMLLKIYTKAHSQYISGAYADKKIEQKVLKNPHLCIYGTTTMTTFADALKRADINSGKINRLIVLPGDEDPIDREKDPPRGIPDDLLTLWMELVPVGADLTGMNSGTVAAPPITEVSWGENHDYVYQNLKDYQNKKRKSGLANGTDALWTRYREHVIKFAMIMAICRSPLNPIIIKDDIKTAEVIVNYSIEYVLDLAMNFMYENDVEKNKKAVYQIIKQRGKKGIPRGELTKLCSGMKSKEIGEILNLLIDEDRVEVESEKTATRPKVVYKSV